MKILSLPIADGRSKSSSNSTSSTISTSMIQGIVDRLKNESNRKSTKANYYGIWRNFNKFFIQLDKKPKTWEERITLYVGYLIDKKIKSTTVRCYLSAIRAVLREDGIELCEDRFLLNSLTRACKLVNDKVRIRLPIQRGMLHILLDEVKRYFSENNQVYLGILYRAILSTAYFGLFRIGELTKGEHPVLAKDVHIGNNKRKLLFMLHTSKTHGRGTKPQIIKISSEKVETFNCRKQEKAERNCPYDILRKYLAVRKDYMDDSEIFFIFRDRSPVTPDHVRASFENSAD